MFSKTKTEPYTNDSYHELPNGYLETIQQGISAVGYFNRNMSFGKGTQEEQLRRLRSEIETADAIVIGAGAGLSTSAGFTYSGERFQLELGVGANTPVIIKYPFWQMTLENENAVYACLNYGEAFCPGEIEDRSICINGDIGTLAVALSESLNLSR